MNFLDTEINYVSTSAGIALFRDQYEILYMMPLPRDSSRDSRPLTIEQLTAVHGHDANFASSIASLPVNFLSPETLMFLAPAAVRLRGVYSLATREALRTIKSAWISEHGRRAWRRKRREIRRNIKILEQNERRKRPRKP